MKRIINKKHAFNSGICLQNIIRLIVLLGAIVFFDTAANAETGRYRVMLGSDSSTEITIGFDAYVANTNPLVYYSTNPININNLNSYSSQTPDITNSEFGMETCFVRLTGLQPGQTYYFVVKDNSSTSEVYNFETIPDTNNTQLSIIAGGDSRNNLDVRAVANKTVSKLQAHAFMFDGDFTNDGNADQWQQWLDDWQLTISSNNRLTPIIPARGNHESNNTELGFLFDCPAQMYYSNNLGTGLLDVYTLNSEITFSGASTQTTWLENEFANSNSIWKFVQYHKPIRPHVSGKVEGAIQYAYWANLFYQYGVDAVLEGDAHMVKTTWPLVPCAGGFNCYEGFKRDDLNGTVYLGEGSYAAPLREDDDKKPWTRDSGSFHQFKWLFVNKDRMEIRTVRYDANTNTNIISELPTANRFTIPQNLEIWDSSNGATNGNVVTLYKPTSNIPSCTLTVPDDNEMYFNFNNITISAEASSSAAISEVQFYVDGTLVGTDSSAPYEINWQPASEGVYTISAIAQDVNGLTSAMDFSAISVEDKDNINRTSCTDISSDEYCQKANGIIYKTSKIKVCSTGVKIQGLRFNGINIPPNATIESANIIFRGKGSSTSSSTTFWAEKVTNSLPFIGEKYNLSTRVKTNSSIAWNNIDPWYDCEKYTSVDLSPIVQELVNLSDWSVESPITFLMTGSGKREAVSSSSPTACLEGGIPVIKNSPQLIVQFSIPDCPTASCDDGNPNTINDTYDVYCRCTGELAGCTDANACNFDANAEVDNNSCTYPQPNADCNGNCNIPTGTSCDDGNPNTDNDAIDSNCACIGEEDCPADIVHNGILSSGDYTVFNSIQSTATIDQNQQVVYDAGRYIHLDKGFIADSGNGVFVLAKIEGCSQLREGNLIEQVNSIKNYPNPFTGETTIEFEVNKLSKVSLFVTDITGKIIATLLNESNKEEGEHQFRFDGNHLAQGVYYCTLIANEEVTTQKMMLMK